MSRVATIFVSLLALCCSFANGVVRRNYGDDPSWNYLQHGEDWNFESCNITAVNKPAQSPLTLDTTKINFDWSTNSNVAFLTGWKTASIAAADHGVTNYTYRINATEGNMGVFYATESYIAAAPQVEWQVEQIRFKYPSEHSIDGNTFDLEMQVVLNDTLGRANYCSGHMGALSVMFNIAAEPANDFWDWIGEETFDFDLSKVFDKTTSMNSMMIGYGGSNTEPTCEQIWCWYLNIMPTVYTIT